MSSLGGTVLRDTMRTLSAARVKNYTKIFLPKSLPTLRNLFHLPTIIGATSLPRLNHRFKFLCKKRFKRCRTNGVRRLPAVSLSIQRLEKFICRSEEHTSELQSHVNL